CVARNRQRNNPSSALHLGRLHSAPESRALAGPARQDFSSAAFRGCIDRLLLPGERLGPPHQRPPRDRGLGRRGARPGDSILSVGAEDLMATIFTQIIEGRLPARFVWKDEL